MSKKIKNPRLQCVICFKTFLKDKNTKVKSGGCLESATDTLYVECPHCKSKETYIVV